MGKRRAQSAMEYLITYGWAILILGIALASLFYLGVFTSTPQNLAKPGECQVVRPNGPGTVQQMGLSGVCGLPPTAVASLNGASGYIYEPDQNYTTYEYQQTISAWIYLYSLPSSTAPIVVLTSPGVGYGFPELAVDNSGDLVFTEQQSCVHCLGTINVYLNGAIKPDTWYFVYGKSTGLATNTIEACAESGQEMLSCASSSLTGKIILNNGDPLSGGGFYIGSDADGDTFDGLISNVQFYNAALAPSTANALYLEGIGAAPINLQALQAWYPLNENANDYGGNGYDGNYVGTGFSSTWLSSTGYATP